MQRRLRQSAERGITMTRFPLAILGVVAATAASAQSLPECKGHFEVIRADDIKPGKMDEFRKAVADHQAWYAAHGLKDRILLAQIINQTDTGTPAFATDKVLTIHTETPGTPAAVEEGQKDAAWSAYVNEYKDSSTITSTTIACVEDGGK
jgi:hypothetical protein